MLKPRSNNRQTRRTGDCSPGILGYDTAQDFRKLARMYRAVTRQIEVTVEPNFLPERSSVDRGQYFWSYTIVITNTGPFPGQYDVVGATLTDNVPAAITGVTWTCSASAGSAPCTAARAPTGRSVSRARRG